ncbi:hypothetical protein CCR92_04880 [Rhodospirillum rubrum]|nr:hypothetical protein [Rhodospirillum rubrum]
MVFPCWIGGDWLTPGTLPNYASALAAFVALAVALLTLWIGQLNIKRIWRRESHYSAHTLNDKAYEAVNLMDIESLQEDDSPENFRRVRENIGKALKILKSVERKCHRVPDAHRPFGNLIAYVKEAQIFLTGAPHLEKRGPRDTDDIDPKKMVSALEEIGVNASQALTELQTTLKPYLKWP